MEGKCNKAPNTGNNNNNSKYMDHVYCHTSQPSKSAYCSNNMTTTGGGSGGGSISTPNSDVLALLKENKQLKGMLILHLDLIQEQSDQLMAKDKALITQNEELETLRARNATLENHVQELQRQLQRQIKRSGEMSTLPPPPLAKIQCKSSIAVNPPTAIVPAAMITSVVQKSGGKEETTNIIGECNGQFISKIVLQRVTSRGKHNNHRSSPHCQETSDSDHDDEDEEEDDEEEQEHQQYEEIEIDNDEDVIEEEEEVEEDEEDEDDDELDEDTQGTHEVTKEDRDERQCLGAEEGEEVTHSQEATSVHDQSHVLDEFYDTGNSTEDSNEVLAVQSKRLRMKQAAKQSLAIPRGAKPSVSPASITTNDGKTTFKAVTSTNAPKHLNIPNQPILSRGKQMTIMRWHTPDYHTDESVSCDSTAETEKRSTTSVTSCSPPKPSASQKDKKRFHKSHDHQHLHNRSKSKRCSYISTPQLYSSREWEDEAFNCDFDIEGLRTESKLLLANDSPKLEIPKWTEHELTPSYCIEGTEDLSDDVFLKRHAKLEVDEKRRKKWDVQQIREQRRIERLKRRHYKDDVPQVQEETKLLSFYPTTENLQSICFVQDLPVQAFGEMIPKLSNGMSGERKDFSLPWLNKIQMQLSAESNKKPNVSILNYSRDTPTSLQAQQQMLNSSFVVLKKRKRQQSSSCGVSTHNTTRQRTLAAKNAMAASSAASTVSTTLTTVTQAPSANTSSVPSVSTTTTLTFVTSNTRTALITTQANSNAKT